MKQILEVGNGFLVLGEVVHFHVDPSVWRDGRVAPDLLEPVCRLSGTAYAELGEIYRLPRPFSFDSGPPCNQPSRFPLKVSTVQMLAKERPEEEAP